MNRLLSLDDARSVDLGRVIFRLALFNFLLVTLSGVFLRYIPVGGVAVAYYKNIIHAHSHFAFGGWVLPALFSLLLKYFPEIRGRVSFRHWRNIAVLLLVSAYGMLLSFPFQGYGAVSIVFSTLSILATFYLAFMIWRVRHQAGDAVALRFLLAGLFYLVLSSAGPFATAPLIIAGKAGEPIYFNVIYFYLHLQYNGWFSFLLLAVLYKKIEPAGHNGQRAFLLFNASVLPTYFLSVLWSHPPAVFYWIAGAGAVVQLAGLFYLWKDIRSGRHLLHPLMKTALAIFALKIVLQAAGALPYVADLAFQHRNFIIAYLHMVLLGFVSLFILSSLSASLLRPLVYRSAVTCMLTAFIITESLLVAQATGEIFSFRIPQFSEWLLAGSCLFPVSAILFLLSFYRSGEEKDTLVASKGTNPPLTYPFS